MAETGQVRGELTDSSVAPEGQGTGRAAAALLDGIFRRSPVARRSLLLAVAVLIGAGSAPSLVAQSAVQERELVNVDSRGVALQGYDPVSFFSAGAPAKGRAELSARHGRATYHFSTEANRAAFEADPTRYAPQFGGFCAWAVSRGYTAKVEIDTWQIVDGRLILNYNSGVKQKFNEDQAGNLRRADGNWPDLVRKEGKTP
jgi:YHS domain-containing protein